LNKTINFLFGSGLSRPAGYPSIDDITRDVLFNASYYKHTDGRYYLVADPAIHQRQALYCDVYDNPETMRKMFFEIKRIVSLGLRGHNRFNYEELYYLVGQINDSLTNNLDNFAIEGFIDEIAVVANKIFTNDIHRFEADVAYSLWAKSGLQYIADVVRTSLNRPFSADCCKYLTFLCDAVAEYERVNIYSLNHDLLLEQYFKDREMAFWDGFSDDLDAFPVWRPRNEKDESVKIKLLKLHGSIDWYRMRPDDRGDMLSPQVMKIRTPDIYDLKNREGKPLFPLDNKPVLLIGTFNKFNQYLEGIFIDLIYLFYKNLFSADCIVVTGYGFGDKGINNQLIHWMNQGADKKMIIIHPETEKLLDYARMAVLINSEFWKANGQLRLINKKIEETRWDDIRAALK